MVSISVGERSIDHFELVPFPVGLWIWEIAHHLYEVGAVLAVELQRAGGVLLGGLEPKVMPEGKWRAIDGLSGEGAVDTFLAR